MPIIDLQRRMREIGRIRTGVTVGDRKRPSKLETFRLTSPTRELIEEAAVVYRGEVRPWQSPSGPEWEVITEVDTLDIIVPPGQSFSQWYELWSGGGCQRRCDGQRNVLTDGPCECPADPEERRDLAKRGEACKPTSRLNVILPAIPDLGVWRLESHGYYAAVELAGSADFLAVATQAGALLPARLRLDQREKKVPGKPTNKYAVPVIEFVQTRVADLIGDGTTAPRIAAPERPALPPGPALPERSDFRAKEPAGFVAPSPAILPLGNDDLARLVRDAGIPLERAEDVFRREFPNVGTTRELTDAQRGHLWTVLSKPECSHPASARRPLEGGGTACTQCGADVPAEPSEAPSLSMGLDAEDEAAVDAELDKRLGGGQAA